ncbi:MAG: T9SS type A sorting domain-containing protein [Bacteroidetes bacterium]|nr:MAG: T9SS type A sorting domain-containing protein [Bacteroidota bacterium]
MKKVLLSLLLASPMLNAQITINSIDLANLGDTVRLSIAPADQLDFLSTGPDMNWDFSQLGLDSQVVNDYRPVSETNAFFIQPYFGASADEAHQASYYRRIEGLGGLDTGTGISIDQLSMFSKLTNDAQTTVGYSASFSGIPVAIPSDSIETVYDLPLSYEKSWSGKGFSQLDLSAFNFAFKQFRTRESVVDGWGNITTPYGSFEVLRVKHIITEIDSVLVELDSITGPQWYGFETPLTREYEWIAKTEKEPILKIITSEFVMGVESVSAISYRDTARETPQVGLKENAISANALIYPNPNQGKLHIESPINFKQFEVYSLQGKKLISGSLDGSFQEIITEKLSEGSYVLKLIDRNTVFQKTFIKKD